MSLLCLTWPRNLALLCPCAFSGSLPLMIVQRLKKQVARTSLLPQHVRAAAAHRHRGSVQGGSSQSDSESIASPTAALKKDLEVVEAQLRVLAERHARVEAELLHVTCEETYLRKQQRRFLHGILPQSVAKMPTRWMTLHPEMPRRSCWGLQSRIWSSSLLGSQVVPNALRVFSPDLCDFDLQVSDSGTRFLFSGSCSRPKAPRLAAPKFWRSGRGTRTTKRSSPPLVPQAVCFASLVPFGVRCVLGLLFTGMRAASTPRPAKRQLVKDEHLLQGVPERAARMGLHTYVCGPAAGSARRRPRGSHAAPKGAVRTRWRRTEMEQTRLRRRALEHKQRGWRGRRG